MLAIIIVLTLGSLGQSLATPPANPFKPGTARWHDYQCRVLGAVCPAAPRCQPAVIEGERRAVNVDCRGVQVGARDERVVRAARRFSRRLN